MKHRQELRVLVVVAHPDDEVLGCGATMARLAQEGAHVFVLVLGEGITSRDGSRDPEGRRLEIETLREQCRRACDILGVKKVFFESFPDNRFDGVELLDLIKEIERIMKETAPEAVWTHFSRDLNVDHRRVNQAVVTACRPIPGASVREVLSFPVASSTEWQVPSEFHPDLAFDVTHTLEKKLAAFQKYPGEIRPYPHPRSLEGIRIDARYWGKTMGCELAEVFQVVRILRR